MGIVIYKIRSWISDSLGIDIHKSYPRRAVSFAKSHFNNKEIVALEIGIYKGRNAISILKNLNVSRFIAIDPYVSYIDYSTEMMNSEDLESIKNKAFKRLSKFKQVSFIYDFSFNASRHIENDSLDFVYIDGNHSIKYVANDLVQYWNKIKINGILSGHDFDLIEVNYSVLSFAFKRNLKIQTDKNDWWIIKTKEQEQEETEKEFADWLEILKTDEAGCPHWMKSIIERKQKELRNQNSLRIMTEDNRETGGFGLASSVGLPQSPDSNYKDGDSQKAKKAVKEK